MPDTQRAALRDNAPEDLVHAELMALRRRMGAQILGQQTLVDRLLVCLLSDGHLLVEGMPGLAKTTAVKALAEAVEGDFHRIQFTPDLLPSDLIGTDIYRHEQGEFEFRPGPLFHNVLLADEVNRAPAKVQSALLEAMAEHQITVGQRTYPLPRLFLVMATQNPIEQEGTYPLPEAQLDRFLLHVRVGYPDIATEKAILALNRAAALADGEAPPGRRVSEAQVLEADTVEERELLSLLQALFGQVAITEAVRAECAAKPGKDAQAIVDAIAAGWMEVRSARAFGTQTLSPFVTPEDVQELAPDCLRHRLLLDYEAEAEGRRVDDFLDLLLARVPVP